MKIAVPTANGLLCMHFGHCETFAVLDVDDSGAVLARTELTPPPHEPGVLPAWLKSQGVDHVIAGGMGSRAQAIFAQSGITVTVGAQTDDPAELARLFVSGQLTGGDNVCDH